MIFLIVVFSVFFIFVFTFTKGIRPLKYLFYFWIIAFHFGPRGEDIFGIKVFYLEGITWLIFFLLALRFNFFIGNKNVFPKYTFLIFLFFLMGIYTAISYKREIRYIIEEFKVFLVIIPTFYITYIGFKYLNIDFNKIINIFALGVFILSLGAVLFYFFPSLADILPQFEDSVLIDTSYFEVSYTEEKFIRLGGSFWGLLIFSAYLLLLFFPLYVKRAFTSSILEKCFYFTLYFLIIFTTILNGHRSIWLGFLIGWCVFSFLKGFRGLSIGVLISFFILQFLPKEVIERFFTIFQISDITWTGRISRFEISLEIIRKHPIFGLGWTGSGWVHNFILQLGANLGLVGLFVFLLWLGKIIFSSFKIYRREKKQTYSKHIHLAFLVSSIAYLLPMAGESLITWPSFMIPYWFFLAVLHNFNSINTELINSRNL